MFPEVGVSLGQLLVGTLRKGQHRLRFGKFRGPRLPCQSVVRPINERRIEASVSLMNVVLYRSGRTAFCDGLSGDQRGVCARCLANHRLCLLSAMRHLLT